MSEAAAPADRDEPRPTKEVKVRMLLGTIVRIMARAPKSREGDHFHVAVGRPVVNGVPPMIPDWAYDKHTVQGRKKGRGLDHFRQVSTQLVPPPDEGGGRGVCDLGGGGARRSGGRAGPPD